MAKNIWKSYIWPVDKDMDESDPRSNVHYLSSSENKAWKKIQACTALVSQKSWVHIPYRPEFLSGLIFTTAQVVYITARITFIQVCILLGKHTLICRCYELMYMFIHYFLRELLRITNRFSQSYFISNSSPPLPSRPLSLISFGQKVSILLSKIMPIMTNLEQLPWFMLFFL